YEIHERPVGSDLCIRDSIYVDVSEAIDIDLSRPRGKGIVTTLNGRKAQYMEPIETGDVIEVYWKS
ncbi:MAG: hypothetical protein K2M81_01850, partial [Lachnospiraceae bacterium]|nr:hypothetical protein [Lachnospiraceae bacterium]